MVANHIDVSENSGTPKPSILVGFSIINHPFWGTPIFWKHPYSLIYIYMMIYLEAYDFHMFSCFHWRLGLPIIRWSHVVDQKLKTRKARFQNKHLHCSSVLGLKFFGGRRVYMLGGYPAYRTNSQVATENRPLSLPQKESGWANSHHVLLICYLTFR